MNLYFFYLYLIVAGFPDMGYPYSVFPYLDKPYSDRSHTVEPFGEMERRIDDIFCRFKKVLFSEKKATSVPL